MAGIESILPEPVPVHMDKDRALLYDLAAFAYLERKYDGVDNAMEKLQGDSFVALVDFIYAGLMHEVREPLGDLPGGRYAGEMLTAEMVERMLAPVNVNDLQEPLAEALQRATTRPTIAGTKVPATTTPTPILATVGTGPGSTTSAPSSSEEVTATSGE